MTERGRIPISSAVLNLVIACDSCERRIILRERLLDALANGGIWRPRLVCPRCHRDLRHSRIAWGESHLTEERLW
ncbi:MAG: hypothetical protein QXD04_06615 [Candidatus Bathyarchaeia archaeon]